MQETRIKRTSMEKKIIFLFGLSCLLSLSFTLHVIGNNLETGKNHKEYIALKTWRAGEKVSHQSVKAFGIENCFKIEGIGNVLFKRMEGKSFKQACTVPRSELRYIKTLHYNKKGEICLGEMVCNKAISKDVVEIFYVLYKAHYPIERMVLIDEYDADDTCSMEANNSSSFNFRFVSGTQKLSSHSRGLAIDINPLYNPYVRTGKNGKTIVLPSKGAKYADRSQDFPYKIDTNDLCYKEFIKRGFKWGGAWKNLKDYQHFEKTK